MTLALRILRLLALTAWVGGLFFFAFVAYIAFQNLPDTHQAGLIVRGSLLMIHRIGFIAGGLYLAATLVMLGAQRDSHPVRAIEMALVIAMLALTAYSQFSILPHMENDRIALGGNVDQAPADAPARVDFNRLHQLSVRIESVILIEGILLLALAPIHGHDDLRRFS